MTDGSGDSRFTWGSSRFGDGKSSGSTPTESTRPASEAGRTTEPSLATETNRTVTGPARAPVDAKYAKGSSQESRNTRGVTAPVPTVAAPVRRPMTVGTQPAARKKGRRARLTLKRIDPWTTLKFSFVYGLAGMIVLVVSVIVLYGVVDAMGVIDSLRSFVQDFSSTNDGNSGIIVWLGFDRVLLVTVVVGLVNVVLFTAFATLTAFVYNVCTDIVGGIEVTLAERN